MFKGDETTGLPKNLTTKEQTPNGQGQHSGPVSPTKDGASPQDEGRAGAHAAKRADWVYKQTNLAYQEIQRRKNLGHMSPKAWACRRHQELQRHRQKKLNQRKTPQATTQGTDKKINTPAPINAAESIRRPYSNHYGWQGKKRQKTHQI